MTHQRWTWRWRLGDSGLILAYVDDCNILLCHEDVLYFLNRFKELA
jgi:hypothetical protein